MLLSDFILENINEILAEWEKFARTIPASIGMDRTALRDEASRILKTIAQDMKRDQSPADQEAKSKGEVLRAPDAADTGAESHADARLEYGFNLTDIVSEYRALRATVIRLWTRALSTVDGDSLLELTRFNEGIDQAVSESIAHYEAAREHSRELFLGVLGHDLRTPIGVVLMAAEYLLRGGHLTEPQEKAVSQILRSATRIKQMVADLLGVAHIRLGGSLPVDKQPIDLKAECQDVIEEVRALHLQCTLTLNASGDLSVTADSSRIAQLLTNLVQNAIQHGRKGAPITVSVRGESEHIVLKVHNEGSAISESARQRIFDPLVRGEKHDKPELLGSLGLGLYIAREIAKAHGGSIEVESSDAGGTSFTVLLPR